MRPRHLDEYIGQAHIIGHGRLLRRAIEADRLGSLIFHGPPGTGKTTLAQVIAGTTRARFTALNAVLAGVKDIRESMRCKLKEVMSTVGNISGHIDTESVSAEISTFGTRSVSAECIL